MPDPQCVAAIQAMPPPLNVPCPTICGDTDFIDHTHCSTLGVPTLTPIITKDPNFGPNGGYCYCCCSCFTIGTPIEVDPNKFNLIENIQEGDYILAAGLDLKWAPSRVFFRSGLLDRSIVPGLWQLRYRVPGEAGTRDLFVTRDHLFLMHNQRILKPVQLLAPGEGLTARDGGRAEVTFAVQCDNLNTAVHSLLMDGDFDGVDPTGHLVNANGVVTADYRVQNYYEKQGQNAQTSPLFATTGNELVAGTPEYAVRYQSAELRAYLNDPSSWPKGIIPVAPSETIRPPREAVSYLTTDQAADISKSLQGQADWSPGNHDLLLRLFKEHRAYYPDTICMIDRDGETPNVFAWCRSGQKFLLFTGAFLRVGGLYREAYSLILAVMQAYLNGAMSVADAEYEAVAYLLREKHDGSQYASLMTEAMEQVKGLFGRVSQGNAQGGPAGVSSTPPTADRLKIYDNAISFRKTP